MASAFELALQEGIRDIVDSDLGQVVTLVQAAGESEIRVVWREGKSLETAVPQCVARVFVALEDFTVAPVKGDQFRKDGSLYEVREIEENGVGGAYLFLRFVRKEA